MRLASQAETAGSLGDVMVALGRLDRLPAHVFMTREVQAAFGRRIWLEPRMVLSGPARTDRRAPSPQIFEMHASFLPRE